MDNRGARSSADQRSPGARSSTDQRSPGGRGSTDQRFQGGRKPFIRKKVCRFCKTKGLTIDYKDAKALRPYLTERGRILPRRISGVCAKHQRMISTAIKQARNLAIVPFTVVSM
ncbi:MAG: 30S ribosomal protein S18 [Deltaproteobacteria bacterium]